MSEDNKDRYGYEQEGIESIANDNLPKSKTEVLKDNFMSVFGHGIGKLSLIACGIVIFFGLAFAIRGMSNKSEQGNTSVVNAPKVPVKEDKSTTVTESEVLRRKQIAQVEAQKALDQGKTYLPGFDPYITKDPKDSHEGNTAFSLSGRQSANDHLKNNSMNIPTGSTSTKDYKKYQDAKNKQETALQKEYDTQVKKRDEEVAKRQNEVIKIVENVLKKDGQGFANYGSYTTVSFNKKEDKPSSEGNGGNKTNVAGNSENKEFDTASAANNKRKPLIKTGNTMYGTLDSEANTDDSNDVFGTIQGGEWDGSKIIGKLEQNADNISFKFSKLAPQDGRPTLKIYAVALREEDAKQGMAEDIDSHILTRYASLGAASLLAGYGRAYAYRPGTAVVSSGGVFTTQTTEPSNKQIIGRSLGEVGRNFSQEMRRDFNKPTTYSTPANKGFILYFMDDVYPSN